MRRQYRCLCEGDQEVEYFKRLQHLINAKLKCAERKSRVTFNTPKGSYEYYA